MSINEIINEIKRNMDNPKELEKILSELSDEELRAVISELTNDEYDELKSKIKNKDLLRRMEAIRGYDALNLVTACLIGLVRDFNHQFVIRINLMMMNPVPDLP